jgi:hypothetical protein
MIKGKSIIELFDGTTGKKVDEHEDKNLVTNIFRNMFDLREYMAVGGINLNSLLDFQTPLFPAYLRGVLLWNDVIPENPDLFFAPPGVKSVGHAGTPYSGTHPTRGTYNENESSVSENGARMVWDFGTDKANGVIKSLSLTSVPGGNHGWMTPPESGMIFNSRLTNVIGSTSSMVNIVQAAQIAGFTQFAGEFRRGIFTYLGTGTNNRLSVLEQSYVNPQQIGIFDKAGVMASAGVRCTQFEIASDTPFDNLSSFVIDENKNYVHAGVTGGTSVRIRTVNLINKTIASSRVITLSEAVNNGHAAFYKNHVYAVSASRSGICKFTESGQFVERVFVNMVSPFLGFAGNLLLGGQAITDGINTERIGSFDISSSLGFSESFKAPLFLTSTINGILNTTRKTSFITPYMATINNLSSQVNKTPQHTMKVTYELTQD